MQFYNHRILIASFVLSINILACRPVLSIGWSELFILIILIVVLLGPFLMKIYRLFDKVRKVDKNEKKNQS